MEGKGVAVGADGMIAANGPTLAAFDALRAGQTLDDQKRSTRDALRYAASRGLTTHHDKGGGWPSRVDLYAAHRQPRRRGDDCAYPGADQSEDSARAASLEHRTRARNHPKPPRPAESDGGWPQLTRAQALRLWGSQNAWFTGEEDELGSIDVGKFADVAVLSADVLDPAAVSDEAIKRVTSILTIVDGRIVHDSGVLATAGGRIP